ncbi:MAG: DUF58 domain-containing protein [Deltaproteobacteria bacterium]|nr:DUF58 domain-containing protein [Deltaproteobacteria bacterium]
MIPTGRLLLLLLGPATLGGLGVVLPVVRPWVYVADAVLLLLALADLVSLPRLRKLKLDRRGPTNLSVGTTNRFVLVVQNLTRRRLHVRVVESFPSSMSVEGLPAAGVIRSKERQAFAYRVVPRTRGAFEAGRTYLRVESLLKLWRRQYVVSLPHAMKVFPDVKKLGTYALLARRNRIDLMGFRLTRGRGQDQEFDRLRDYQPDDDYRRIDPFASARYLKLITREYQVSRNQNVFFMVDCSRLMAGEWGGLSNLDHALNATLMLSHLALDLGDNVGLLAFDERVHTFLPIATGLRSKTAILHSLYDLHVSSAEPDYEAAFLTVQRRVRQRSLVVLLTNVMDAASFELLKPHLRVLLRRHLPLVLLTRDADLFALADSAPATPREMYQVGAAAELATWREHMVSHLQRMGALVLDIHPGQTTPELINRYLQVKAEQLL